MAEGDEAARGWAAEVLAALGITAARGKGWEGLAMETVQEAPSAVAWAKEAAVRGAARKAEVRKAEEGTVRGAGSAAEATERTRASVRMSRAPAAAMAKGAAVAAKATGAAVCIG